MKKILFTMLSTLLLYSILLDACTPDVPENEPHFIEGLQFNPDYFQGPGVLTSISPDQSPCSPGQGNCIMVLPTYASLSQDMNVAFSEFKRYCTNKDIVGFFSNVKSWEKLLPGLKQDTSMLRQLMNGTYKMQVAKDNKAIIIYKGLSPNSSNIIKAYWYNHM